MLYLTRIQSAASVVDDGTSQPALDRFSSGASIGNGGNQGSDRKNQSGGKGNKARSRSPQFSYIKPDTDNIDAVYSKNGRRFCEAYNSVDGCHKSTKECTDLHICKHCKRFTDSGALE